ncbi:MAG: VTT domain-containing protein, partial [Lentisphaeria bacterium]|nr:VTT domain-containing protein [Lentisphaeria bacterium]
FFSFTGSFLAGLIGYFVAYFFRERGAHRLVTETDLENFKQLFDRWGSVTIMVCRALPVLPEVTTVMAGLAGMPLKKFIPALFVGSLSTAVVFTSLGLLGKDDSMVGLVASVLLPAFIWLIVVLQLKIKRSKKEENR